MSEKPRAKLGIIGGTGLGDELLERGGETINIDTPFGPPSCPPILAEWEGTRVAFIARHGAGHTINPSNVPYRANIWALKKLGVTSILASGATGSLREDIEPAHLVICDQVIDRTFRRPGTFFDHDAVAHVELADPFCPRLRNILARAGSELETTVHGAGTYVCMEGPQFSTRAESNLHRQWGGDLIGMTCMPEAKLAREAEICYALVALPTDYDCWRPADPNRPHGELLREILGNLKRATSSAIELMRRAAPQFGDDAGSCHCHRALELAVWTEKKAIPEATVRRLHPLIGRYLPDSGDGADKPMTP